MNLFFPSFLPKFYGFTSKEVYLSITISLIWSSLYALIFGHLTAKISKISLLQSVIVASIFLSILIHYLLLKGNLIFALCLYQSIITSLMVITFPLMAETFTSSTRFTIMAICYNITFAIISFIPIGVMNMATTMNGPIIMWIIFILLCVFTLGNMSAIYRKE
jgi:MHS family proline/betaine transporter-like MFS transporter